MARQPVKSNGDGTYRLDLRDEERALITTVIPELRSLLVDDPDHDSLARLFPTARPDDHEAEIEFQELVRKELVSGRLNRLDTVAELAEATVLTEDQLAAWMSSVNDIRLVLGTRLQVSEDDDFDDFDVEHPNAAAYSAYWFLGWLLEQIVEASASDM